MYQDVTGNRKRSHPLPTKQMVMSNLQYLRSSTAKCVLPHQKQPIIKTAHSFPEDRRSIDSSSGYKIGPVTFSDQIKSKPQELRLLTSDFLQILLKNSSFCSEEKSSHRMDEETLSRRGFQDEREKNSELKLQLSDTCHFKTRWISLFKVVIAMDYTSISLEKTDEMQPPINIARSISHINFQRLEELNLFANQINNVESLQWIYCPQLNTLNLIGNHISRLHCLKKSCFPKLSSLYLIRWRSFDNNLSRHESYDATLNEISRWNLEIEDLRLQKRGQNPVLCQDLKLLAKTKKPIRSTHIFQRQNHRIDQKTVRWMLRHRGGLESESQIVFKQNYFTDDNFAEAYINIDNHEVTHQLQQFQINRRRGFFRQINIWEI